MGEDEISQRDGGTEGGRWEDDLLADGGEVDLDQDERDEGHRKVRRRWRGIQGFTGDEGGGYRIAPLFWDWGDTGGHGDESSNGGRAETIEQQSGQGRGGSSTGGNEEGGSGEVGGGRGRRWKRLTRSKKKRKRAGVGRKKGRKKRRRRRRGGNSFGRAVRRQCTKTCTRARIRKRAGIRARMHSITVSTGSVKRKRGKQQSMHAHAHAHNHRSCTSKGITRARAHTEGRMAEEVQARAFPLSPNSLSPLSVSIQFSAAKVEVVR